MPEPRIRTSPPMKNQKTSGKGSSHKASSAAHRKTRWGADNAPSDSPAAAEPKPSNPRDGPAGPSQLPPKDRPIPPSVPSPLPQAAAVPPFALPDPAAATSPPPYGFHNLDRRTIILADGSVRSYFALPPDYSLDPAPGKPFPFGPGIRTEPGVGFGLDKRFPPPGGRFSPEDFREPGYRGGGGPHNDYWSSLGLEGPRAPLDSALKRKRREEDEYAWHREHVFKYGNPSATPNGFPLGPGSDRPEHLGRTSSPLRRDYYDDLQTSKQRKLGGEGYDDKPSRKSQPEDDIPQLEDDVPAVAVDVDAQALKKAFLRFSKSVNENLTQRKNYLEDGKNGPLQCIVCGRTSKEFTDVHGLIMHAYTSPNANLQIDHLGLHKALCVLMGWNYAKAPGNSKAYQSLSADDAAANREDLILWPPTVIIHNTNSGRNKEGRMEGMGNKAMDTKLKELGVGGGKSKSIYGKEGHLGITLVKFADTPGGLKEAERLAEFFEKDNHGRRDWACVQASESGDDDEKNPALVKVDVKTGEKTRIFYGYLATASDLEKVDFDTRKKAFIKSGREFDRSD